MIRIEVRPAKRSAVSVENGRYSIGRGVYTGSYTVEPDERGVTLETKNKIMTENVSVAPVPRALDGVEITPDFSGGDFAVSAYGALVRSAVIKKPDALKPENIVLGANIAGIVGTHPPKPRDVRTVTFKSGDKTLCERSVGEGDSCAEVVSRGIISEPEPPAESLAFCGWAGDPGGIANRGVLNGITGDKSVYAVFTSGKAVNGVLFIEYADTAVLADNCLEVS